LEIVAAPRPELVDFGLELSQLGGSLRIAHVF
jgi:hypothetical protein